MRYRLIAAAGAVVLGASLPAMASGPSVWNPHTFDANLSVDGHHMDGEPSIAVNPVNPKNMIAIYLLNNDMFVPNAYNTQAGVPSVRDAEQQIQGCNYAVTFNGGRTWTRHALPANDVTSDPLANNCSDSIVVFDRRGVAYVMASAYASAAFGVDDEYRLISSRDGGRTWSKPGIVAPTMLGKGSQPSKYNGLRTYDDRPWLTIDPQTNVLYIDGTQVRLDHSGAGWVYLTASSNGGRTFSDPIVVPSGPLGSAPLGAAFGTVALAVSPAPGEQGTLCNCLDFLVSRDRARHLTTIHTRIPALSGAQTVADPTRRGRFAVMVYDANGHLLVYRTTDAGRTWHGPAIVGVQGTTVVKPWMAYSPQGVLGLGWRAQYPDKSYAFFGAVSTDHGRTLTRAIQISRVHSPQAQPYYVAGDDTSTIAVTKTHLYGAWGDWRGGGLENVWWGGFPLPKHK